jgi:hypothetical protein
MLPSLFWVFGFLSQDQAGRTGGLEYLDFIPRLEASINHPFAGQCHGYTALATNDSPARFEQRQFQ